MWRVALAASQQEVSVYFLNGARVKFKMRLALPRRRTLIIIIGGFFTRINRYSNSFLWTA
jgi:hypothetical protein